ncbi:MAG: SPOR domain-containing protein [Tenuifilaceae bacterium]|jgi:cell division protein FtsN|nr:SPOR domain-containing protein [Tenuifilaceae bacterium]
MRKALIFTLLLAFTLSGCRFFERFKGDKGEDTLIVWQAKQDSIKKAEMLRVKKIEEARRAKEKAIQDSLTRVREMEARNRYHVIIGSFKVPNNASEFQKQMAKMGFQNPKIVESPNGFKMVSVGAFETYSKAANEILRINRGKEEPVEMWVYKAN